MFDIAFANGAQYFKLSQRDMLSMRLPMGV